MARPLPASGRRRGGNCACAAAWVLVGSRESWAERETRHERRVCDPRGLQPEPAVRGRQPFHHRPGADGGGSPRGRRACRQAADGVRRRVRQRRSFAARTPRQRESAPPQAVRRQGAQARRGRVPSGLSRVHGDQHHGRPALLGLGPPGQAGRPAGAGGQRRPLGRHLHGDPDGGRAPVPHHHDQCRGAGPAAAAGAGEGVGAEDPGARLRQELQAGRLPSAASPSAWA